MFCVMAILLLFHFGIAIPLLFHLSGIWCKAITIVVGRPNQMLQIKQTQFR